jgi:hypothetical protein
MVSVRQVQGRLRGPWVITWDVPRP